MRRQSLALLPSLPPSLCRQSPSPASLKSIFTWGERFFHRPKSPLRSFPENGFTKIDVDEKIEEETLPFYDADRYYPVRIGEVLNSKYQVLGKLDYGVTSTVWLCRDLQAHLYRALKVHIKPSKEVKELVVHRHLSEMKTSHVGKKCIRTALDAFEVSCPNGNQHICLAYEPLEASLHEWIDYLPDRSLPEELVKIALRELLVALDFLHTEAHLIHTDIQPRNILNGIEANSVLAGFEEAELEEPAPRKLLEGRIVHQSRAIPLKFPTGMPLLCDFGHAVLGDVEHEHDAMPDQHRAPEIILNMKWSYEVDIWNVGVMIWSIFETRNLFYGRNPEDMLSNKHHLAEIISVLGPPTPEFLKRSEKCLEYWDETGKREELTVALPLYFHNEDCPADLLLHENWLKLRPGNWRGLVDIPDTTLNKVEVKLNGENKDMFLRFMRRMLQWEPDKRATARDLLFDPWLRGGWY